MRPRWSSGPTEIVLVRHGHSVGNLADARAREEGAERLDLDARDADVELSGTGVGAATKVLFGTSVVTAVTKVSDTRVRVVTPAHAAGVVSVQVMTSSGTSPVSTRSTFAYDAVPTVTALPETKPPPLMTTD